MISLIIPVYKNEANLDRLLGELVKLSEDLAGDLEVVFVVDGSPDRCHEILAERLPGTGLRAQLLLLTRNFGSFSAISAGLVHGCGDYFAVLAADLQEPPALVAEFYRVMANGEADIVFGVRASRSDPWLSEFLSSLFWRIYRRFVVADVPPGGVDVFGCTRAVRDQIVNLSEANTNLIALLFWLGYRRHFIPYNRQPRREGRSAWTFGKKVQYCINSIFNFTDLPIRFLLVTGLAGVWIAVLGAVLVLACKLSGLIEVPGYTPLILAIMFFGALTVSALGIVGQYIWLSLQNTRARPNYIVWQARAYDGENANACTGVATTMRTQ